MQNYQFKTPESVNITKETIKAVKELLFFPKWQFWVIVGIFIVLTIWSGGFIFMIAPVLLVIYVVRVKHKIEKRFWKDFAVINGWQYIEHVNPDKEHGIMLRQGHTRLIENVVLGVIDGRKFRIFNYNFSIGSDKHERMYDYTVFAFKFDGIFPHFYLNSKNQNSYSMEYDVNIESGEVVPLSGEFDKKFTLSVPKKYEIEALEIFTPDIMVKLLDNEFSHDVEFVDSEMLIFTNGRMNSSDELEKEFKMALEIEDLLDEKLDRFKFSKIGDMPHTL